MIVFVLVIGKSEIQNLEWGTENDCRPDPKVTFARLSDLRENPNYEQSKIQNLK